MNELIVSIFKNFAVDGKKIPVKYLYYNGHGEPYVTFTPTDNQNILSADDDIEAYITYYDFDIYSKENYYAIETAVKALLKSNDFTWNPERDSAEMYETDTGYFHKTICFSHERSE